MTKAPRVALGAMLDRSVSPKLAGPLAAGFEATGVVDDFIAWDQLCGWWPNAMWVPENTPLANLGGDTDSFHDAFQLAAFAAAGTNGLGVTVSTDAIRRGPAELMQTMLSLASATEGNATLFIGAGEAKQARPYGHKRSEGLDRLEDLFRAFKLFWESDEPVDLDGNVWKLRQAWLGGTRTHRPKFVAIGGGPKLLDIAAQYADGWVTMAPAVFTSPEHYAEGVAEMREALERHDRDPDDFLFGIWPMNLIHEDPDRIEQAYRNPLIQFLAALFGRLNMADWEKEGIQSVFPHDWHYALKMFPTEFTKAQCDDICARTPPEMMQKSFLSGSAKEVASQFAAYVEAGANWISPFDFLPAIMPPEEAQAAIADSIEVCRLLKAMG